MVRAGRDSGKWGRGLQTPKCAGEVGAGKGSSPCSTGLHAYCPHFFFLSLFFFWPLFLTAVASQVCCLLGVWPSLHPSPRILPSPLLFPQAFVFLRLVLLCCGGLCCVLQLRLMPVLQKPHLPGAPAGGMTGPKVQLCRWASFCLLGPGEMWRSGAAGGAASGRPT